jgi:predicted transport protein
MVFATVDVATREASANVVMRVFMEVSFVNDVRLICRDVPKIRRWPAGTVKLPFRKLNSILCKLVGRTAGTSIGAPEDARLGAPGTG